MSLRFSLPLILFLSTISISFAILLEGDDPFLSMVVGAGDNDMLNAEAQHHFSIFKKRFGKSYASKEEHDYRFAVFNANMRIARRHQALDPSAVHGITRFSDLTSGEFARNFLGLNSRRSRLRLPADANKAPILPTDDLPKDFDWRGHGAVTPVKNQVILSI